MKKYTLVIILCFLVDGVFGQATKQLTQFSTETESYIEELNEFMLVSPSEDVKKLMKQFSKIWKEEVLSIEKRQAIYDISNTMLKKRKRSTHFEKMIAAILAFSSKDNFTSEFNNWSTVVLEMLKNSSTSRQMKFLTFSKDLFEYDMLMRNRSVKWMVSSSNYTFSIDSIPRVHFNQPFNLLCLARGDTLRIKHTEGVYLPINGQWKGKSGVVDWQKAGFSKGEVYAELSKYKIKMRTPGFSADSVRFYNNEIFEDRSILGTLEDKLIDQRKDKITYPKFESYNKKLVLSQLIENADFVGGYSLYGNRFVASGGKGSAAKLVFYRNGQKFIEAASDRIAITNNRVMASDAAIKILFLNDSILHPGLDLRFDQEESRLDLIKDGDGLSAAPYLNTYHDLEMNFQVLKWKTGEDVITFGTLPAKTTTPATFESANFYTDQRFDFLMGIDSKHPLVRIRDFMRNEGFEDDFLIDDFVRSSKLPSDQAKRFLMWMSAQGFLIYNATTGEVKVKDRVYRYLDAKAKKTDYDVINFISQQPKENKNAILDLNSMDLTIFGVENVFVSNVRDVIAIPRNKQIVVKENRDFSMSGRLIAGNGGRFRINCESIDFDYDEFKMEFTDASTEIWIPNNKEKYDEKGNLILERLESEITIANGELVVDTNINKSGIWKEDYPEFPIIRSYDKSKVYYDDEEIFSGVYNRENFFFEVDPFEIDSLDTYTRESLSFPGDFYSADILPVFRQELRVQKDNALGFVIYVPEEGYPLYIDKGFFHAENRISLDKSGLRGSGQFDYLTSVTQSDDYVFFPDSMNTYAQSFSLERTISETEYPDVSGESIYEHWEPYNDVLLVRNEVEDLVMYNAQVLLDGQVFLRPEGLTGGGNVKLDDSELNANLYAFNLNSFNSDTADFRLNRTDLDAIAFESINLQTEIDLVNRTGVFQSNGTGSFVTFPENQYICYIDQLKWFMDKSQVELGVSEFGSGSKFVSIHPEQDSLRFISSSASYSLTDYIIQAGGVKEIIVADAEIYPNQGEVTVETSASIRTLENARILVNRSDRIHQLFDASINIHSRNSYSGEASMVYKGRGVDEQTIRFTKLLVLEDQTIGEGIIPEENKFAFNPQFGFKGNVRLEGSQKELFYDGAYQVKHECTLIPNAWVKFNAYVGTEKMDLPVDGVQDLNGKSLHIGPVMGQDAIYPTFLSPLTEENDALMITLKGKLSYNATRDQFVVKDENDSTGNVFTMDNASCEMNVSGHFNLGEKLGRVETANTGNFTYNPMSNTFTANTMLFADFYMSEKAIDQMGQEFVNDPMADELEMDERFYIAAFDRILKGQDLTFEYEMYGEFERLPKELKKSLYFYDLKLEWNEETQSFLSKDWIGLGNIKHHQINKLYKGHVEIVKNQSGDELNVYLETDIGDWYFFTYTNELMLTRSSLDDYNLMILEVKTGQKKAPSKKGLAEYQYDLASEDAVDNFKKRFFR